MLVIMLPYKAPKHGCIFYLPLYSDMWEVKKWCQFWCQWCQRNNEKYKKVLDKGICFFLHLIPLITFISMYFAFVLP
jgi:hypothetical protein